VVAEAAEEVSSATANGQAAAPLAPEEAGPTVAASARDNQES
jgi:hypothetical protein